MLEWMHDDDVIHDLKTNFMDMTIEDCYAFIDKANRISDEIHMAIVDDEDEYVGTVSLKNIKIDTAEFAITVRSSAMGKGYSIFAMRKMIEIGFREKNLSSIYWCVSPNNARAVRFYEKSGFNRISSNILPISEKEYTAKQILSFYWYLITRDEWMLTL